MPRRQTSDVFFKRVASSEARGHVKESVLIFPSRDTERLRPTIKIHWQLRQPLGELDKIHKQNWRHYGTQSDLLAVEIEIIVARL